MTRSTTEAGCIRCGLRSTVTTKIPPTLPLPRAGGRVGVGVVDWAQSARNFTRHAHEWHASADWVLEQLMIRQLLDSDLEVVIRSGVLHAPLLFDPSVDREIRTSPRPDTLIQVDGRHFVRTVTVQSLLESYPAIHPESYEELRAARLPDGAGIPRPSRMPLDAKLRTIVFQVMPHFIRGHRSLERRALSEGELLDWLERKLRIPSRRYEEARRAQDADSLRAALQGLQWRAAPIHPIEDSLIPARKVGEWIHKAMEQRILAEETARVRNALEARMESVETESRHLAVLLHIAEEGSVEIEGFGFSRIGSGEEYLIYKRTGEYALKDYYGRVYLFPDCRVAVSSLLPFKPFVVEMYKHPFLEGYDSGQEICLRSYASPGAFTAAAIIHALEEGMNALLYGYSNRRRNGYHSLERIANRVGSLGFGDSPIVGPTDYPVIRKTHMLDVDFDEYRVPGDHPKVASGQVPVTNEYTL